MIEGRNEGRNKGQRKERRRDKGREERRNERREEGTKEGRKGRREEERKERREEGEEPLTATDAGGTYCCCYCCTSEGQVSPLLDSCKRWSRQRRSHSRLEAVLLLHESGTGTARCWMAVDEEQTPPRCCTPTGERSKHIYKKNIITYVYGP